MRMIKIMIKFKHTLRWQRKTNNYFPAQQHDTIVGLIIRMRSTYICVDTWITIIIQIRRCWMCLKSNLRLSCSMDDLGYFHVIRLGPMTSECEMNVIVMSTVAGYEVSINTTLLHGFNLHVSSRRETVSDSRNVPRFTEKILQIYAYSVVPIVRRVHFTIPTVCDSSYHSLSSHHLTDELVSISSVPISSIELIL